MPTKIFFNGREYGDPTEMPESVRREYEQALAQFEDANKNGIPDVLENASKNIVAIQQSSFTINGKSFDGATELPPWAKALFDQAMGALPPHTKGITPVASGPSADRQFESRFDLAAADIEPLTDPVETTKDVLRGIVQAILIVSAIAVVVLTAMICRDMDASSVSQGGRVYIVVIAIVVLAAIVDRYIKISRR